MNGLCKSLMLFLCPFITFLVNGFFVLPLLSCSISMWAFPEYSAQKRIHLGTGKRGSKISRTKIGIG